MTRWQYKTFRYTIDRDVYLASTIEQQDMIGNGWLNSLGLAGWEIVTFSEINWQLCVLMKRPLEEWAFTQGPSHE